MHKNAKIKPAQKDAYAVQYSGAAEYRKDGKRRKKVNRKTNGEKD